MIKAYIEVVLSKLTTPIETLTLAGKTVYSIADGQLLICIEKEITHDCRKTMAEKETIKG